MNDLKFTTAQDYMQSSRFDDLMYHAGLTAQGCWDEMDNYDRKAIEKFAELIVQECMNVLDPGEHQLIARFQARKWLAEHFGVEP
jgi:hypothetical protein